MAFSGSAGVRRKLSPKFGHFWGALKLLPLLVGIKDPVPAQTVLGAAPRI